MEFLLICLNILTRRVAQDVWYEREVPDDMMLALMRNIMKNDR